MAAAAKKGTKNAPSNKGVKMTGKMVTSEACEKCTNKCAKGERYLKIMEIKHEGNGVYCDK